ncbi:CocE/NonD family hydrolase [Pseudomonas sp. TNT2022 ID1048]|uniref:CocE/NonD family hydrolase n=1 Tax=Pseudomonas idahonensis TaxID=2942628 RepID=UPI002362D2DC|nr:CocE/NonD family hydrolase [Pseudomonas idahonensis]MDD1022867.1 CocE/NonD family hydrolase [Pseudomonas idahonensis]
MDVIRDFPHPIREIEHCLIPLRDGTQLAARIWLPADAGTRRYPAILEYLPYRKRDGTAVRDALTHPWMAGQGYACVRVDMRGNGESQGLMADEYLPQEQQDALEVLDWLCAQPWCDGNLGMMGISWGGFNGLQVAAHQPAALKAIITLCSTDDRYADDIHYKGGNLLMENQGWAATMLNFSAAVPDPLLVPDWQAQWQQRLDAMPMLAETWLQHQTRDDYWRQGSVCEDYAAIKAAVYCIGGWGDAYKNSVPRLMQHLNGPKKALLGPWIHKYPHFAVPNPAIGFLQEAKRWWDHWLKGIDNGVMDEPACTFYLQDAVPPKASYAERPGVWVQTAGWPDPQIQWQTFSLSDSGLSAGAQALSASRSICSPLTTGLHQGEYCAIWFGPDGPTDQRRDDAHSLCFDSQPLSEPLALLGDVRLDLRLTSDRPCGQIVARLNAVAPDGQVAQITYGTLNLSLRDDFAVASPPEPGAPLQVRFNLDHVGYRLPAGYRLRLALSTASFPLLWPARELTTLTLLPEVQSVQLPVFIGEPVACPFEAPQSAQPANLEIIRAAAPKRSLSEDVASGEVCVRIDDDLGAMRLLDHGLWVDQRCTEQYRTLPWDPLSTRADIQWQYRAGRGTWSVEVDSTLGLHADAQWFYLRATQVARLDGRQIHQRQWHKRIARSTL